MVVDGVWLDHKDHRHGNQIESQSGAQDAHDESIVASLCKGVMRSLARYARKRWVGYNVRRDSEFGSTLIQFQWYTFSVSCLASCPLPVEHMTASRKLLGFDARVVCS